MQAVDGMKRCPQCGETKGLTEFSKAGREKDGLQCECKKCNLRYRVTYKERIAGAKRAYREAHRGAIQERDRLYRETHREAVRARDHSYYQRNRGIKIEYWHTYRKTHKNKIARQRQAYAVTHIEIVAVRNHTYYQSHKGDAADQRMAYANTKQGRAIIQAVHRRRSARKHGALGTDYTTAEMITARCALWGNRCYICGAQMQAIDHVKPLAKGGAHLPCNLRPICRSCNSRKKDCWPYNAIYKGEGDD